MDGTLFFCPSNKDSLKGRHVHLSTKAGSRSQASEAGAGATTPEPESIAERSEKEAGGELSEVEKREDGNKKRAEREKVENERKDETKAVKQDDLGKEVEKEEGEERIKLSISDEVEEEFCVGEAEEVSGRTSPSSGQKRSERNEKDINEEMERRVESQNDESKDVVDEREGEKDADEPEIEEDISEEGLNSNQDGFENEEMEKPEMERNLNDESQGENGKEEEGKNHERMQKAYEEGESGEALEGCSISHRKFTETPEEVSERFVQSEGEGMWKEGVKIEDESGGRAPSGASESEEEAVEVFKAGPSDAQPAGLGEKTEELNKNVAGISSSLDQKKVLDINDASDTISPLEKDERDELGQDKDGKRNAETSNSLFSLPPSEDKEQPTAHKADRLVLHLSSPSLSSSSDPEQRSPKRPQAQIIDVSLELQRPETSRGRPHPTLEARVGSTEPTSNKQGSAPEENEGWKTRMAKEKEKEKMMAEREERSKRQREEQAGEENERLKREVEQALEEERERLLKEKEKKMRLLQEELRREEEEEERKLREESERKLRELRENLRAKRGEEETRLKEEAEKALEELKGSVREEREQQQQKLRDESEAIIKELRIALEEERAAARGRLEAQKKQDIQRLQAESEEELEATKKRLEREREEKLNTLKQEVSMTERRRELIVSPRPEHQLAEYHRELTDVLQEVRDQVQREHERKLEQLKDDHRREMNDIREKYLEEEAAQRERLLSTLQEDRERLQASHDLQLEKLRLQLDGQIQKAQLAHSRKESELQDLADRLELREKELRSQDALLQTKAADLHRRRKKLGEEEEGLDMQIKTLPVIVRERDQLKEELQRLREEVTQAREVSHRAREERDEAKSQRQRMKEERDRAREDKGRLESKVALLQERCDTLAYKISELEKTKDDRKRAEKATASPDDRIDSSLHVEELDDSPLSPVPDSHSSIDEFREYVSSHGASIQRTKQFLERESRRVMERQAALQAAQSTGQDPGLRGATEESRRTLQQEARDVAELQRTVQRGTSLLRRKEEQLQQLESSMAQEVMAEDSSRLNGDRKVTFDVTESDISSTVEPSAGTGHPTVPAKVQQLAESLQHISGQLNGVLSALGTLAQRDSSSLYSTPQRFGSEAWGPPERLWSWGPQSGSTAAPLFSTPISSGLTSADPLNSRWSQIFPGAAADPISSRTTSSYPSYPPISEHRRGHQATQNAVELDGHRLQGLIDSNKKWLNTRRKDPSIPLFTRYQPASSKSGLIQLGLDDNNQIRVYHY
ncbi:PREDICTED: centrosomal protein of 164 kDa-like [Cyprinodon variegatus]|uniref:centrosomal protein of 164 kDa-like n=1 Tax=Cyprinodon variegatus TaxID=28743 RepID=UPI000742536D|nr:PREDICTED: centrosomal protein of 164 kDa-like [Cyprinodon variegatus]